MILIKILSLTVSASSSNDTYWAPERDVKIYKILVTERGGTSLTNVFCKISKADVPLTKEAIPLSILNVAYNQAPPIELTLEKGVKLKFEVTNNLTSDVNLDFIIFYE